MGDVVVEPALKADMGRPAEPRIPTPAPVRNFLRLDGKECFIVFQGYRLQNSFSTSSLAYHQNAETGTSILFEGFEGITATATARKLRFKPQSPDTADRAGLEGVQFLFIISIV